MTMLDDDRLATLLASAGRAFEVPPSGTSTILARAAAGAGDGDEDGDNGIGDDGLRDDDHADVTAGLTQTSGRRAVRRMTAAAGGHRLLTVAACLAALLVAAAGVGALVVGPESPTVRSGLAHAPKPAASGGAPSTTTTVPSHVPASSGAAGRQSAGAGDLGAKAFSTNTAPGGTQSTTSPTAPALPNDAVGQSAKIEQTGTLGLSVKRGSLARAMTQLTALAATYDGFVSSSQTQSGASAAGVPTGSVTLQVPVGNFAAMLAQAQKLGRTTGLTTNATDVTGQYVDLQSRIAALQASRQQYLTILTKANTVGDVLAVQSQVDTIQSQIEQLQGQLQVLTSQTSYSKLTVDVGEGAVPAPSPPAPEPGVVRAWHESLGGFVAGVDGLIRVAGPLLFALVCAAVAILGGRALWRRLQRHRL